MPLSPQEKVLQWTAVVLLYCSMFALIGRDSYVGFAAFYSACMFCYGWLLEQQHKRLAREDGPLRPHSPCFIGFLYCLAILLLGSVGFMVPFYLCGRCNQAASAHNNGSPYYWMETPPEKWETNTTELPKAMQQWAAGNHGRDDRYPTSVLHVYLPATNTTLFRGGDNGNYEVEYLISVVDGGEPTVHTKVHYPFEFVKVTDSNACFVSRGHVVCYVGHEIRDLSIKEGNETYFQYSSELASFGDDSLVWFKGERDFVGGRATRIVSVDPVTMIQTIHSRVTGNEVTCSEPSKPLLMVCFLVSLFPILVLSLLLWKSKFFCPWSLLSALGF